MRLAVFALLVVAAPALAVESGHSGVIHSRTGPELSDIALFVLAVVAVWQIRRALRKRFGKRKD